MEKFLVVFLEKTWYIKNNGYHMSCYKWEKPAEMPELVLPKEIMEKNVKKQKKHIISTVQKGSIAEELELVPGDALLSVNGQPVEDIFDYRYLMNEEYVVLEIEKANKEIWELEVEKEYEEDLGVEFEQDLMDDYRSCSNHCIFCFIDQMPPGMRETLYFKDDDSRLSFIQGNYVTLTNMSDHDIEPHHPLPSGTY